MYEAMRANNIEVHLGKKLVGIDDSSETEVIAKFRYLKSYLVFLLINTNLSFLAVMVQNSKVLFCWGVMEVVQQ